MELIKEKKQQINTLICKNCNEDLQSNDNVCYNCGLETGSVEYSSYNFEEIEQVSYKKTSFQNSKMAKIQEWFTWTSEEKNEYKLNKYTKEFCYNLNNSFSNILMLNENIIEQVVIFVSQVMKAIKDNFNGPKRSKVKDGLIIMCIYYVLKSNEEICISYIDISKKLKIEMKYISNANKTITLLINNGKLKIKESFKDFIFKTEKPMDYIKKIIDRYSLSIDSLILIQVSNLIDICEDNDILLDHTPLSIGVSCFYYILTLNSLEIDIKLFSELYNISIVTIDKTFKKLLCFKEQFSKLGINALVLK
jgi:transcription initiation factor TFIIIB Brf1 subunit/transcription initiation factor TFIIB